jgi:PleD family two-component response regulator
VSTDLSQKNSYLILVVDDDKSMRMLLRLALEQEGYKVLEAEDGRACLAAYQRRQPDAILLDALMPEIDGFACCSQLRTLPNGDRIPVLMLTVLDDPDAVEQAFASGATDYITKPIHWSVLRHRLRHLLEQYQLYKQLEQANQELQRLASLVARYEQTDFN